MLGDGSRVLGECERLVKSHQLYKLTFKDANIPKCNRMPSSVHLKCMLNISFNHVATMV